MAEPCIPVAEPRIPVAEPCIPVAEPRIPVVEPRIPVAEPRIPELAEPRTFKTLVPRVLFEDEPHTAIHPVPCVYSEHTSLITSVVKSCISLASKLRTYKRDMTAVEIHRESRNRVLLGEEPSISLAPKSRTLSRIRRNILAIPLGKKSSISYKELIVLLGKSPTRPRVTDGIANFRKEYIEELRLKKCSDYCYKKFMELGKMLEVLPYNDSVCKMCMYQSSIAVPANAVFYSCGHNFLCHQCAMKYWNEGKSCGCAGCLVNSKVVCPICSEEIQDVIKSYCPF